MQTAKAFLEGNAIHTIEWCKAIRTKATSRVAYEAQVDGPRRIDHESRTGAGSVSCSRKEYEQCHVGRSL